MNEYICLGFSLCVTEARHALATFGIWAGDLATWEKSTRITCEAPHDRLLMKEPREFNRKGLTQVCDYTESGALRSPSRHDTSPQASDAQHAREG